MEDFLPIPTGFNSPDLYIQSLIDFTSGPFFRTLVGGVHILDFFTLEPDLYESILPEEWRFYFEKSSIERILELLLRTDSEDLTTEKFKGLPQSLLSFVHNVKGHELNRRVAERKRNDKHDQGVAKLARGLKAGMTEKKIHEVEHFTSYLISLLQEIESADDQAQEITHLVDFGSGLSYLSRALASPPNNLDVVAIESKKSNIEAGKMLDIRTKLTSAPLPEEAARLKAAQNKSPTDRIAEPRGSIQYVEKVLADGDMSAVLEAIISNNSASTITSTTNFRKLTEETQKTPELMIISLHSCGNLIHHALRALLQTNEVKAVAVVGCCYNLVTERDGQTYKPPYRNFTHGEEASLPSTTGDPDGFPLSDMLSKQQVNFNITARMMACQAPYNWTPEVAADFFKRHFYRALLQRILLDHGVLRDDEPVIIGSLRKKCYSSFHEYVTGAIEKILRAEFVKDSIKERIRANGLTTIGKEAVELYEAKYEQGRKNLSVVWSLMAFCAGCVESLIVIDRWLFLKESGLVRAARVEAAFEYSISPRNLVVVGVK